MSPDQLLKYIIRPTLQEMGPQFTSQSAEVLLLITAAVESDLGHFVHQVGGGPAMGLYQMEPDTHEDLWDNWLDYRPDSSNLISGGRSDPSRLMWDLRYSTQLCRMHYWRFPEPLPEYWDRDGHWAYYRYRWNSFLGATSPRKFNLTWTSLDPISLVREFPTGVQVA